MPNSRPCAYLCVSLCDAANSCVSSPHRHIRAITQLKPGRFEDSETAEFRRLIFCLSHVTQGQCGLAGQGRVMRQSIDRSVECPYSIPAQSQ
ncbi:unnamed protein product [Protopolystoma xenopodis]|uniref:Uncharacterized protein n=1 Tax=Protopolystoma xenopodis TaxID=117903 RepID=A0A3S5CI20_9PLAT|nr:unnamed protein product [Protopolystoma xenopodis]